MKSNPKIISVLHDKESYFQLQDSSEECFKQGRVKRILERYRSYFIDFDSLLIDSHINYISLQELIKSV